MVAAKAQCAKATMRCLVVHKTCVACWSEMSVRDGVAGDANVRQQRL